MMRLLLLAVLVASAQAPTPPAPSASDVTLRMLDLPIAARSLRSAGVPEAEVRSALAAMRGKGLGAADAEEALQESADAAKVHGPVDNFGAFVQSQLDAGLRGRELAAAIQTEHLIKGKKHGKSEEATADAEPGKGQGKDGEHGKPADKATNDDKGKPADMSRGRGEHADHGDNGMSRSRDGSGDHKGGQGRGKDKKP